MSMESLEKLLNQESNTPSVKGEWFSICWKPDAGTQDLLTIGVGFVENGRVHSRVLDYFERIKCLYADKGVYHAELVTSIVKESLRQNVKTAPIPQITYTQKGFAQGFTIEEVVSSLFEQTVALAKKIRQRDKSKERFSSINTEKLYTCLLDELKVISGIEYDNFTPPDSSIVVGQHELFIPFRDGKNLVGGLASAVYSNTSTIELSLLKAARDVEAAVKLGKGKNSSIFILKPGNELNKVSQEQTILIDNIMDKFDWHMKKQGIKVGSHTTFNGLAEEIYDWAKVA